MLFWQSEEQDKEGDETGGASNNRIKTENFLSFGKERWDSRENLCPLKMLSVLKLETICFNIRDLQLITNALI